MKFKNVIETVSNNHELVIAHLRSPFLQIKLYNNVELINNIIMDVDYKTIFIEAMKFLTDPEEMREYCIRQQKKAYIESYYSSRSFYKGLLKVVRKVKRFSECGYNTSEFEPMDCAEGWFIYHDTYAFKGYLVGHIELLEQIIYKMLNEGTQEEIITKPFFINKSLLIKLEKNGFTCNTYEIPIMWLKNKQLLRELLMHENIKKKGFKSVDVEKATPHYFVDKNSVPIKLANNKPEPSFDSDWIKKNATWLSS